MVLDLNKAQEMQELIHQIYALGWSPATSTNYSFRNSESTLAVSRSGIDKSKFNFTDWMLVDLRGQPLPDYVSIKPSAELFLHVVLYQENPSINYVLHTHTYANTVLSRLLETEKKLVLSNYELLKCFEGVATHDTSINVPIFPNTQNIVQLSEDFRLAYRQSPQLYGYLIAGHGLYTWGNTLAIAKRHLESFEFLLECEYRIWALKK